MRSFGFTLVLALLAAAALALAGWQFAGRNFDDLFGAPPVPVGSRIYENFKPADVKSIRIARNGDVAMFKLGEEGWQAVTPWKDRMDPRSALAIINFTLGMRVEDHAPADEIAPKKAGLADGRIDIRLDDKDGNQLARYKLGRQTPWLATYPDAEKPVPTVFIQRRDENSRNHIYACTGDIGPLFKNGMNLLRDHHPFYFNPLTLRQIRIRAEEGELTLARETPQAPWRLVKPLELSTDTRAMKSLLEGLYQLQAVKITDRSSATLPTAGSTRSGMIALSSFGRETETVLELQAPDNPAATTVLATVSDRPDAVFELPLKSGPDFIAWSDLPLAVNDLRDAKLTNMSKETIPHLRRIEIQPSNGRGIVVSRNPPAPWMATIDGQTQEANEERLYTLLKLVSESRVTGFLSDAATDFSPWGLDRPLATLGFYGENDAQGIRLAFGTDGKGGYFVNRAGTPTVMQVDSGLIASLPVRAFEWRQARIWSIDRTNLLSLSRRIGTGPPLVLLYDFDQEQWNASRGGADITSRLNPTRANYLLGILEGLKVTRWLSPEDESAAKALQSPSLAFKIFENAVDQMGDVTGRVTRDLILAPAGASPAFYYGRLGDDPQPFLLDRDTYGKLATEVLETEP